ncbi:MAG: M29 family metallopeptidase [Anaerolineae bacterium]
MESTLLSADLTANFLSVLRLCRLQTNEKVLIFSDPSFPHPAYPAAAMAAARSLGASVYLLVSHSDQDVDDELVRAAWTHADLILGMSYLPGPHSWMYAPIHSLALAAGARVLMIQEPPEALKRMLPTREITRRGLAGARLMQVASEIRLISAAGTDLTLRKSGRKGSYQSGVADTRGRWDHWPSGMVYSAPLEDSAEGTLVVTQGDILLGAHQHSRSEIELTFQAGQLVNVEGGVEAKLFENTLHAAGDPGALRIAHAGWGTDQRADWNVIGMDSESFYGGITVALGRNTFDSPAPYSGLGGVNESRIHYDICLRNVSLYLDGAQIIDDGRFTMRELE